MILLLLTACAVIVPNYPGPLGALGKVERPPTEETQGTALPDDSPAPVSPAQADFDQGLVRAASYYLHHDVTGHPDDCSGFVCAIFDRVGLPIGTYGAGGLWQKASAIGATHHRKLPLAGDLAFFDDTWDRNRDQDADDELTHIAIVMSVDDDGTITMANGGVAEGHAVLRMNLLRPHVYATEAGKILNDYLRVQHKSDPPGTRYLAGELWHGFATLTKEDIEAWVQHS